MVKAAPVSTILSGTIQPGKYVILVGGDTASVDVAIEAATDATGGNILDSVFLPDVHPDVVSRLRSGDATSELAGQALSIVEAHTVVAIVDCADAGAKAADVAVAAIRLGDGLGGRGYVLFTGDVAEVEAAHEAAIERGAGRLYRTELISQLHGDMAANIEATLLFSERMDD